MRDIIVMMVAVVTSLPAFVSEQVVSLDSNANSSFGVIGEFSNIRYTAEREYGYSVQLWRTRDSLCGLFLAAEGLQGDTPTGLLDEVTYEAATGRLSFTSKLSIGIIYSGQGPAAPSHDLFKFDGVISGNTLSGTLRRYDSLHGEAPPIVTKLHLRRVPGDEMIRASTYAEWQRTVEPILKRRGPKW